MQITFLGASHGVPEANRRCSCTLIETNGRYYFIDMGVNAIDALRTRGIEVEIGEMVGKSKLSQNKEDRDRLGAAERLEREGIACNARQTA